MKKKYSIFTILAISVLLFSSCGKNNASETAADKLAAASPEVPGEAVTVQTQPELHQARDYLKILNGDLSDFTGIWVNGYGSRMELISNGIFRGTGSADAAGISSGDFYKKEDGSYTWGVGGDGYGGFGVILYPVGVDVIGQIGYEDFSFKMGIIPTDTGKVRLAVVQAPPADSNEIYYLESESEDIVLQPTPGGSGIAGDPFLIYTEADLRMLSNLGYDYVNTRYTHQSHYRLMSDIILSGGNWMPIGGTNGFSGIFDGNGYIISGMIINMPRLIEYGIGAGLFGIIAENGKVENLGLIDTIITVYAEGIGGIAGANYGTIQNCYVTGIIGDTTVKGGIAGSNKTGAVIQNCFFSGKVFFTNISLAHTSGGIAGESAGTIVNCVSLAESVTGEYENDVGRVVGFNHIQLLTGIGNQYGRLINNYGWSGTTTGGSYMYDVTVPVSADPLSKEGADLNTAQLKTRAAWEKAGFSFGADSIWVWNQNGMPRLRNQKNTVPWPEYLENPAVAVPNPAKISEIGY